jgi:hypothetical protein
MGENEYGEGDEAKRKRKNKKRSGSPPLRGIDISFAELNSINIGKNIVSYLNIFKNVTLTMLTTRHLVQKSWSF